MLPQGWKDRSVVITGLGLFTPLGRNAADVCDAILEGRSSITSSSNLGLPCLTSEFPFEDTFGLAPELTSRTDRALWFTMKALDQALENAGLSRSAIAGDRTAVVVGTSHSGVLHCEHIMKAAAQGRIEDIKANDFHAGLTDHVATVVCEELRLTGIKATISSACSSSNTAIGYGSDLLLTGQADRAIVIGTDTISNGIAAGFNSLKVIGKVPAAPFSNPHGISLGEGAGVLILERLEAVLACGRDAHCRGEVLGYALSSDAFHQTSVEENGEGIETVVSRALANSGLSATDVDYISAHGTGTDSNDIPESKAIARLFGNTVKIASVKSSVGHTLGASGVIELIISLVCAERGFYAPNNHFNGVRNGCAELDYVHGPQHPADINTILCNNYGFGGNNSSFVLSRKVGRFSRKPLLSRQVFVSARGEHTTHCEGSEDWITRLEHGIALHCNDETRRTYVGKTAAPTGEKSSRRRTSPSLQFAVQAMENAIVGHGLKAVVDERRYETGIVAGLLHGAQKAVEKYFFSLFEDGLPYARSALFPLTTLNGAAGEVSIQFGIKGFNSTFCGPVGAMRFACDSIRAGHQERMFSLSSDELTPLALDVCEHLGILGRFTATGRSTGFYLNDGASVTLFESGDALLKRGGTRLAEVLAFTVAQEGAGHRLNGDGTSLAKLGLRALHECGLGARDIDLIVGVGQGTPSFLANERNAIQAIFGGRLPLVTSVAMHLGYAPTAILPQMINLATAILGGAPFWEADRSGDIWAPEVVRRDADVKRVLVLFTSVTFEQCALILGRTEAS
jgi:3-oxoacyl-[acyl-carrier-protein] synthase II